MTVVTSVFSASSPASRIAIARMAKIPVTVDDGARRVDGEAPVGVAIVRDPQVGAVFEHRGTHETEVGGPDPVVDVEPVRLRRDRDDLGTGPPVDVRGDGGGSAVGAVDHDPQPVERGRCRTEQVIGVAGTGIRQVADPADVCACGPDTDHGDAALDRVFDGVGELVPTRGEELDAVVRHGVVRGGDHHAEVGVEHGHQERDGGRREHTDPQRVGPGRGEACDNRGLEHLPTSAAIAADDRDGAVRAVALSKNVGRRRRNGDGELRGKELAVGQSAHAVSAEQTTHAQRPLLATTPAV